MYTLWKRRGKVCSFRRVLRPTSITMILAAHSSRITYLLGLSCNSNTFLWASFFSWSYQNPPFFSIFIPARCIGEKDLNLQQVHCFADRCPSANTPGSLDTDESSNFKMHTHTLREKKRPLLFFFFFPRRTVTRICSSPTCPNYLCQLPVVCVHIWASMHAYKHVSFGSYWLWEYSGGVWRSHRLLHCHHLVCKPSIRRRKGSYARDQI